MSLPLASRSPVIRGPIKAGHPTTGRYHVRDHQLSEERPVPEGLGFILVRTYTDIRAMDWEIKKKGRQHDLFVDFAKEKDWKFLSTVLAWGDTDQKPDFLSKWTVPMSDRIKHHRQT